MTRYRDDTQTQTPSRYAKVDWGRGRATHVSPPPSTTLERLHGHHTLTHMHSHAPRGIVAYTWRSGVAA